MKNAIRASIRQFFQRNIIAVEPLPPRSWLDEQNMPRQQSRPVAPVSERLLVDRVPPLRGRHSAFPHLQSSGRLKGRHAAPVHRAGNEPGVNEQI